MFHIGFIYSDEIIQIFFLISQKNLLSFTKTLFYDVDYKQRKNLIQLKPQSHSSNPIRVIKPMQSAASMRFYHNTMCMPHTQLNMCEYTSNGKHNPICARQRENKQFRLFIHSYQFQNVSPNSVFDPKQIITIFTTNKM